MKVLKTKRIKKKCKFVGYISDDFSAVISNLKASRRVSVETLEITSCTHKLNDSWYKRGMYLTYNAKKNFESWIFHELFNICETELQKILQRLFHVNLLHDIIERTLNFIANTKLPRCSVKANKRYFVKKEFEKAKRRKGIGKVRRELRKIKKQWFRDSEHLQIFLCYIEITRT